MVLAGLLKTAERVVHGVFCVLVWSDGLGGVLIGWGSVCCCFGLAGLFFWLFGGGLLQGDAWWSW